jgi:hypothetical protein
MKVQKFSVNYIQQKQQTKRWPEIKDLNRVNPSFYPLLWHYWHQLPHLVAFHSEYPIYQKFLQNLPLLNFG